MSVDVSKSSDKVNIEDISKSSNKVYPNFFFGSDPVKSWSEKGYIHQTVWRGKESSNSFSLKPKETYRSAIPGILIDRFGINEAAQENFKEKYLQAISGDGQEWTRITTLHSSSLLALLFFYSVSDENPLTIKINNSSEYKFTQSFFEVKTQVYEEAESNMDVVLRGEEKEGGKVALFLECKFSEYLNCGKYDDISYEAYSNIYNELFKDGKIDGMIIAINGTDKTITISPSESKHPVYCGGIKQMISHYMGVSNYASERGKALAEHRSFKVDENEKVLLGEILFDFNIKDGFFDERLNNYKESYNSLAEKIKKQNKIEMLPQVLTYQDVLKVNLNLIKEGNIRKFYKFPELNEGNKG